MTIIDTDDVRQRTCSACGAVVWDRVTHQRWHNRHEELEQCVLALDETAERMVESLDHARRLCVALEHELDLMQQRQDLARG